jgi:SAM-dependent methyltransferase
MARLLEQGYKVSGIEPSHEMRRLAEKQVPANLISDGSVLELPATDSSLDFIYAIEVFRYLDTQDNQRGHREIVRALRPGGIYFGTYVNRWALDGFRQLTQFRRLASRLTGGSLRYHVEFESPSSLEAKLKRAGFSKVSVHGAMLAPLRIVYKLSPNIAANVARRSMPHESRLSDQSYLRALAGHLMVIAHR